MDDDFNSAEAIGHIFRLIREVHTLTGGDEAALARCPRALRRLESDMETYDGILGLFAGGVPAAEGGAPEEIEALAAEREEARKAKDWARADELRDRIAEAGYVVEDRPEGPRIRPAKSSGQG